MLGMRADYDLGSDGLHLDYIQLLMPSGISCALSGFCWICYMRNVHNSITVIVICVVLSPTKKMHYCMNTVNVFPAPRSQDLIQAVEPDPERLVLDHIH